MGIRNPQDREDQANLASEPSAGRPRVLIVGHRERLHKTLVPTLGSHREHPEISVVPTGEEALGPLEAHPIDLVVVELDEGSLDPFNLIAYIIHRHPRTDVLIDAAHREVWPTQQFERPGIRYLPSHLREAEAHALLRRRDVGPRRRVALLDLLKVLQDEEVTCSLDLRTNKEDPWAKGNHGLMHFDTGHLVYAEAGDAVGLIALLRMLDWNAPELSFHRASSQPKRSLDPAVLEACFEAASLSDRGAFVLDEKLVSDLLAEPSDGSGNEAVDMRKLEDPDRRKEIAQMPKIQETLDKALELNGALGAALVDYKTGMLMAKADAGSGLNLELAAAGNTEVVRAKQSIVGKLGLKQRIEDILITLETQFHLIRVLHNNDNLFFYLVLDRSKANLAMARMELENLDLKLEL